jgi:hypothetical protein
VRLGWESLDSVFPFPRLFRDAGPRLSVHERMTPEELAHAEVVQWARRLMPWWQWKRVAANGRHEVTCRDCARLFWLTDTELVLWSRCAHCVGWWTWEHAA